MVPGRNAIGLRHFCRLERGGLVHGNVSAAPRRAVLMPLIIKNFLYRLTSG